MCLQEDVLCILSGIAYKTGHQALNEAMRYSRHASSATLMTIALEELVEKGLARVYTEECRRDGIHAQIRIKCTPPLYRCYRLSRLGEERRRLLMSKRRREAKKHGPRAST